MLLAAGHYKTQITNQMKVGTGGRRGNPDFIVFATSEFFFLKDIVMVLLFVLCTLIGYLPITIKILIQIKEVQLNRYIWIKSLQLETAFSYWVLLSSSSISGGYGVYCKKQSCIRKANESACFVSNNLNLESISNFQKTLLKPEQYTSRIIPYTSYVER